MGWDKKFKKNLNKQLKVVKNNYIANTTTIPEKKEEKKKYVEELKNGTSTNNSNVVAPEKKVEATKTNVEFKSKKGLIDLLVQNGFDKEKLEQKSKDKNVLELAAKMTKIGGNLTDKIRGYFEVKKKGLKGKIAEYMQDKTKDKDIKLKLVDLVKKHHDDNDFVLAEDMIEINLAGMVANHFHLDPLDLI